MNALILGDPGSGKSFFINTLTSHLEGVFHLHSPSTVGITLRMIFEDERYSNSVRCIIVDELDKMDNNVQRELARLINVNKDKKISVVGVANDQGEIISELMDLFFPILETLDRQAVSAARGFR